MMDKNSGVYFIKNIITGKLYVGSSINLKYRKRKHLGLLKREAHYNDYLQSDYNKKPNAFIFGVKEFCPNKKVIEKEQKYIDKYKSYKRENGYNICKIAGRGPKGANNPVSISCTFINPKGEVVNTDCIKELSRNEDIEFSGLCKVASGTYFQHKGWRKYSKEEKGRECKVTEREAVYKIIKDGVLKKGTAVELSKIIPELSRRGINCLKTRSWTSYKGWELISINGDKNYKYSNSTKGERARGSKNKNSKTIKVLDPDNNVIEITGINEFCRRNDLNESDFYQMLKEDGKCNQVKGYTKLENYNYN